MNTSEDRTTMIMDIIDKLLSLGLHRAQGLSRQIELDSMGLDDTLELLFGSVDIRKQLEEEKVQNDISINEMKKSKIYRLNEWWWQSDLIKRITDGEPKELESILGDSPKLSVMMDIRQKEIESDLDGDKVIPRLHVDKLDMNWSASNSIMRILLALLMYVSYYSKKEKLENKKLICQILHRVDTI